MLWHPDVGRAVDYVLECWTTFSRFLNDGWTCLKNRNWARMLKRRNLMV